MKYLPASLPMFGFVLLLLILLAIITGLEAQASGQRVNPFYGFGYCTYKMPSHIGTCADVFWRRLTDPDYEQCMQDTEYPAACLDDSDIIQS